MKLATTLKGRFANFFRPRGEVAPEDLIEALEREVAKRKNSQNVVPNHYTIYLCEEDCHRLSAARIIKALHEAVERKVIRENCFMDGNLSVRIEKMNDGDDAIVIKSKFMADSDADEDTIDLENESLENTLVDQNTILEGNQQTLIADKEKFPVFPKFGYFRKIDYEIAKLTVDREEEEQQYILGERQFYIGRKDSNDLVLADDSVSRIHAFISYDRHRHVLCDANSLNGTYINKRFAEKQELNHGDKILIGNILVTYEVL